MGINDVTHFHKTAFNWQNHAVPCKTVRMRHVSGIHQARANRKAMHLNAVKIFALLVFCNLNFVVFRFTTS